MPEKKTIAEIFGPAIVTGLVAFVGFQYTANQSDKKMKEDRELWQKSFEENEKQWRANFEANQRQANDKIAADYRNLQATIDSTHGLSTLQRSKEFRLKYYERQMAFFEDFCKTIARIAASKKLADVQDDVNRFNQSLIATVPLFIEGPGPDHNNVVDFHRYLNSIDPNKSLTQAESARIRTAALDMAKICRASLVKTFELDKKVFGELPPP